jgi:hypothetical protein
MELKKFVLKREEVTGEWRYRKKLHNLYNSSNTIIMT